LGSAGEMFGMCYDVMASPYLTYQVFSKGGDLMKPVPITLQDSAIMHDFAITENYVIFMDPPVAVNVKVCRSLLGNQHLYFLCVL
jgi:carotenoid cleavage dioxygenase-like enzyme